jgi:hypothetical protein
LPAPLEVGAAVVAAAAAAPSSFDLQATIVTDSSATKPNLIKP